MVDYSELNNYDLKKLIMTNLCHGAPALTGAIMELWERYEANQALLGGIANEIGMQTADDLWDYLMSEDDVNEGSKKVATQGESRPLEDMTLDELKKIRAKQIEDAEKRRLIREIRGFEQLPEDYTL